MPSLARLQRSLFRRKKRNSSCDASLRGLLLLLRLRLWRRRLRHWYAGPTRIWYWRLTSLLLLLLHLKLPLLHFLQHLLRSSYSRLVRRRRWLFRFRCALILLVLVSVFILRIGLGSVRRYFHGRTSVVTGLRGLRIRIVRPGFGHQHHPHQLVGIVQGTQQYVIEAGSIQQFGDYFTSRPGTEARHHALVGGGGDFDVGGCVLAHATQNVTQGGVRGDDGQQSILKAHLGRYGRNGIQRNLRHGALRTGRQRRRRRRRLLFLDLVNAMRRLRICAARNGQA